MGSPMAPTGVTHESAHHVHSNVQVLPKGAILLGVLKSVETELRRRRMLGDTCDTLTPVWFLAETERNIFLWRNGKSLDDQQDFDFWVDIKALMAKRRKQLENPRGLNPFVNPLWGTAPLDQRLINRERDYLDDLEELGSVVMPHAEALSHASRTVRRELEPESIDRTCVLLPVEVPLPRG
jgi:hypothetical protein